MECRKDCPFNQETNSNENLAERLNTIETKVNTIMEVVQNKNPDTKQTGQDPANDVNKSWWPSVKPITDIINNLTNIIPVILNTYRGFPSLLVYGGLAVGGLSAILLAIVAIKAPSNQLAQIFIFSFAILCVLLAFAGYLVWVIRDPDRTPGQKQQDADKKSTRQQNNDNKIDNSENDDDMSTSVKYFDQEREFRLVFIKRPKETFIENRKFHNDNNVFLWPTERITVPEEIHKSNSFLNHNYLIPIQETKEIYLISRVTNKKNIPISDISFSLGTKKLSKEQIKEHLISSNRFSQRRKRYKTIQTQLSNKIYFSNNHKIYNDHLDNELIFSLN